MSIKLKIGDIINVKIVKFDIVFHACICQSDVFKNLKCFLPIFNEQDKKFVDNNNNSFNVKIVRLEERCDKILTDVELC